MYTKLWNLALRELYHMGKISRELFGELYEKMDDVSDNSKYKKYYLLIIEIFRNKELFVKLVHEEIRVVTYMELPAKNIFKKMYISYLLDCLVAYALTEAEVEYYENKIDFANNVWTDVEKETALYIIDKLRMSIVLRNPDAIEYMENLTFDMLMDLNNIG